MSTQLLQSLFTQKVSLNQSESRQHKHKTITISSADTITSLICSSVLSIFEVTATVIQSQRLTMSQMQKWTGVQVTDNIHQACLETQVKQNSRTTVELSREQRLLNKRQHCRHG